MGNIFAPEVFSNEAELFETLLNIDNVKIERIVTDGTVTCEENEYYQSHDEWVVIIQGSAALWIEGKGELFLKCGESFFIKAHTRHKVLSTQKGVQTIWLAVHVYTT